MQALGEITSHTSIIVVGSNFALVESRLENQGATEWRARGKRALSDRSNLLRPHIAHLHDDKRWDLGNAAGAARHSRVFKNR